MTSITLESLDYITQNLQKKASEKEQNFLKDLLSTIKSYPCLSYELWIPPISPIDGARPVALIPESEDGPERKILILNHPKKDKILGAGGEKIHYLAIDVLSAERFAATVYNNKTEKELDLLDCIPPHTNLLPRPICLEINHSENEFNEDDWEAENLRSTLAFFPLYNCGDLQNFIRSSPHAFTINKLTLLDDMLRAVCHLHNHNVIHRDIKPENFLVSEINGNFHAVISDLGLACMKEDVKHADACGTLLYTAPEHWEILSKVFIQNQSTLSKSEKQRQWAANISKKNDIWALGLVLLNFFSNPPYWIPEPVRENRTLYASWLKKLSKIKAPSWVKNFSVKNAPSFKKPPKGTLLYLVWKMLQVNPEKRIDIHGAWFYLRTCKQIDFGSSLQLEYPLIYPPEIDYNLHATYVQNLKALPIQWEHGEDDIYKLAHLLVKESNPYLKHKRDFTEEKQPEYLAEDFKGDPKRHPDYYFKHPKFSYPIKIYNNTAYIKLPDQEFAWCNLKTGKIQNWPNNKIT
jgi:serine/threonine protein kinase